MQDQNAASPKDQPEERSSNSQTTLSASEVPLLRRHRREDLLKDSPTTAKTVFKINEERISSRSREKSTSNATQGTALSPCDPVKTCSRSKHIKAIKKRLKERAKAERKSCMSRKVKAPPLKYAFVNKYSTFEVRISLAWERVRKSFKRSENEATSSIFTNSSAEKSVLIVCQHWDMDFKTLQEYLAYVRITYCDLGHHGLVEPICTEHKRREVSLDREEDGEVVLRKLLVLAHCPNDTAYPPVLLQRRLEQLQQSICPHVFLDSDTHLSSLVPGSRPRNIDEECMCCSTVHSCPNLFCDTKWWITRRGPLKCLNSEDYGIDEVVLNVSRRLGKMEAGTGRDGVEGKRYLSQTVDEATWAASQKKWRYNEKTQRLSFS